MVYVFEGYELDTRVCELRLEGESIRLEPRVFDVLVYLIQHRDRLVTKQELFEHLWPEQFVGEAALERCIQVARRALGDSGREQRCITTIRGRGYRFVAPVEERVLTAPGRTPPPPLLPPSDAGEPTPNRPDTVSVVPQPHEEPSEAGVRHCAVYQHVNSATATYCTACGSRLLSRCPACGQDAPLPAAFCPACGAQFTAMTVDTLPAQSETSLVETTHTTSRHPDGEHRQVTVLCCTLANTTALAERTGLAPMRHLVREVLSLVQREVERFEGTVQSFGNDGVLALFGVPVAYEDHAGRALLAALGMQRRVREHAASLDAADAADLAVRMGLHTGRMVVGQGEVVGDTANLAVRLQYLAEPDTLLVSESSLRAVQTTLRVETSEPIHVIGQNHPVTIYRVLGAVSRRSLSGVLTERPRPGFVGRQRELAMLHDLLTQARQGQGQVVGIVGEPGMGKSRLLDEFRRSLTGEPVTYLEGNCLSYGQAMPYLPLIDMLRITCDLQDADTPETIAYKVRQALAEVGIDPEQHAPYLMHLLGLSLGTERLAMLTPEAIKARTFETLRQMSLHSSGQRPLIVAVEDLHWIDTISEACFATVVESLAGARIVFVATYRPGYRPPWVNKSYVTQIALHRLRSADSRAVVQAAAQQRSLAEPLIQTILAKAEGNPLFLEELTRAVVEQENTPAEVIVPETIQGVLMARLERLHETSKRVLQTAAVLGRQVSLRLLKQRAG